MKKYLAEATDIYGQEISLELEANSLSDAREICKKEETTVSKIVLKRGHHLCKYCHSIAEGDNEDILCDDCHYTFGHYCYSEL